MSTVAFRTELPRELESDVRQVSRSDDLLARFRQSAAAAGIRVHPATAKDWVARVQAILREHAAKSTYVEALPESAFDAERAEQLRAALESAAVTVFGRPDDETLFAVDASVTGVRAAIAETGTIVCETSPGKGEFDAGVRGSRGASLIAPVHIAIVGAEQIVPDLLDYFAELAQRDDLPANCNLITGPSKTADIENTLVTGVHGPGHVHVVLVGAAGS